jgi:sulfite exporter TauE/SafE
MVAAGVAVAMGLDNRVIAITGGSGRAGWLTSSTAAIAKKGTFAAFPFGVLMGFLPCGMLAAIELRAIATSSAAWGAAIMLAFGLGTVPGLSGFGAVSGLLGTHVRGVLLKIGAVIVIVIGLLTIVRGIARISGIGM